MAKETPVESDIEAQLMALLLARVQAEHEQLIRELTAPAAFDALLREVLPRESRPREALRS